MAILVLSGLFFFSQALWGQTNLQGRIVNKKGGSFPRMNLRVYLPGRPSLISFALPAKANMTVQPDCKTYTMTCSSGSSYYVVACSDADKRFRAGYYCN